MRVCLDARYFTKSGASTYIHSIVPQLVCANEENRYILVKYPEQSFVMEDRFERVLIAPHRNRLRQLLWVYVTLPSLLTRYEVDIYHPLKFAGALWDPARTVLTMHSITRKYKGEFPQSKAASFYNIYANWLFKRAGRIMAVSPFLKQYLIDMHGLSPDKIDLAPHGIHERFRVMSAEEVAPTLVKLAQQRPFVICVGNVFRVKNHVTAVRAFSLFAHQHDWDLVIVGATTDPYYNEVLAEVKKLHLEERVRFLGFVEGNDLVALMNAAKMMLFPSLSEGAGISMLEAFRCGLPVIAAKRGGLWDMGKDAALFVEDPNDAAAFARNMVDIASSAALRERLNKAALSRSAEFSWVQSAAQHLLCYQRAHADSPTRSV